MLSFKQWINELVDPGEPQKERPDLLATALHGIHPPGEDPPTSVKTPIADYIPGSKKEKSVRKRPYCSYRS